LAKAKTFTNLFRLAKQPQFINCIPLQRDDSYNNPKKALAEKKINEVRGH